MIEVKSREEAWMEVNKIFPTDYEQDMGSTERAGYPIYRSTAEDHYYYYICDLGCRLELNMGDDTVNVWINQKDRGEDMEITVIAKTGETRTYSSYAEYRKEFRFFWSSGTAIDYEDGIEKHYEKIISCLRQMGDHKMKVESHRNGLTTIFTYIKYKE